MKLRAPANSYFKLSIISIILIGEIALTATAAAILIKDSKKYTIYFDSRGGSQCAPIKTAGQEILNLPQPTRPNYVFIGWFQSDSLEMLVTDYSFQNTPIKRDITLYAGWEPVGVGQNFSTEKSAAWHISPTKTVLEMLFA